MTLLSRYFRALVAHETALWNAVDRRLAQSGALRLGRLEFLRVVTENGSARVQDVAEALGITVGAASRLTDRLVADGLVQREAHPSDRRSSLIQLSASGRAAFVSSTAAFDAAIAELLGSVDEETVLGTLDGLERIDQGVFDKAESEAR
ncbi:MarR family winged helix-turn-helix transcriptional regulator [Planctomonas deserti]|uniref:MarR family winged helix-turn-helix transcriptional regulator n=1 Tax=Planctomonas deserti TaxID=2144185 RepID=UPI000D363357|nr:MarR family transcriptional regulator [Planctomonas deserti]